MVWHPAFAAGRDLAHALYRHLSRDVHQPRFRGLGIPVFFRSLPGPGAGDLPLPVPVDGAEHTAVVVLVDDELVVDERWEDYLLTLRLATGGFQDRDGGETLGGPGTERVPRPGKSPLSRQRYPFSASTGLGGEGARIAG